MVLEYRLRPFKELKRSFGVGHISTSRPKLLNEPTLAGNDPPAIVNMPPCDVEYGPLGYVSVHRNFPTRAPSTPSRRKQIARMLPSVIGGPGGCLKCCGNAAARFVARTGLLHLGHTRSQTRSRNGTENRAIR